MSSQAKLPLIMVVALSLTACGERGATGWAGQIDTLSNGVVRVSNPAAPLWDSAGAWMLEEELRIGSADAEGPEVFGSLAGLAVDADGRIWVVDRQARELRIFGPDGFHARTVGREGEGPGEFQDPIGVEIALDGRIWVVDAGNARYSIHDPTGDFVETRRRMIGGYSVPWRGGFEDDGWFWEPGVFRAEGGLRSAVLRMDPSLAPRDTVLLPQVEDEEVFELTTDGGYMTANVPFTPDLVWERAPDGALWLASTGDYRLHRTVDGDMTRIIEREFDPVPVTDQEKDEAVENLEWFANHGGQVDWSRIPDTKPILSRFTVDPAGRLWVLVNEVGESEGYPFDVFDPEGRYLGRMRSPIAFDPRTIFRDDEIYGVGSDELGAPQVVRLRLQRPAP